MEACGTSRRLRPGFTLLELLIAAAITASLVAALLSAWSSSMDFAFMVNQNLRRMAAQEAIRSAVAADLDQSALFTAYDCDNMQVIAATADNTNTYPRVAQGGRELRFLRFRTSLAAATSPLTNAPYVENLLAVNAQALSQFATAPVSPYFVFNPAAGTPGSWNLSPVWDSDRTGLTFTENCGTNPVSKASTPGTYLRIYRYVLVPYATVVPATLADATTWATTAYPLYPQVGPTIRRGMLLRQYCNAQSTTWVTTGPPLSDAIVFDVNNVEFPATPLPCFIFGTLLDGSAGHSGVEIMADNEVRLKMTFAQEVKNGRPVQYDLRLSFPFRRISHGD